MCGADTACLAAAENFSLPEKNMSRKEARRQRAMERDREREKKKLEDAILKHKKEIELLAEKFSVPEIHGDYEKVKVMGDEINKLKKQIANKKNRISAYKKKHL